MRLEPQEDDSRDRKALVKDEFAKIAIKREDYTLLSLEPQAMIATSPVPGPDSTIHSKSWAWGELQHPDKNSVHVLVGKDSHRDASARNTVSSDASERAANERAANLVGI